MSISIDLSGKHAVITGATHGLGLAIALKLGLAGAKITVTDRFDDRAQKALDIYQKNGIDAEIELFDITNAESVKKHISKIEKRGPINILVNNAGIIKRTDLVDMEPADFREVVDVNLTGAFIVSQQVIPSMITEGNGKIVNICSLMSELGRQSVGAYAASKGGLQMLTRSMATEWAKFNVQINAIAPGYIETEQTAPLRVEGNPFIKFIKSRTPANRWGQPEDVAGTALFLVSELSDFINGQTIFVDGGITATLGAPYNE
jgi:gluconate 5-dehydrogenase